MIISLSVLYAYRMTHVYEAATPVHHFTAVQVDYPRVYRLHTYNSVDYSRHVVDPRIGDGRCFEGC
jgi:hypothetical protein